MTRNQILTLGMLLMLAAAMVLPGCSTPEDRGLRDWWDQLTKQAN